MNWQYSLMKRASARIENRHGKCRMVAFSFFLIFFLATAGMARANSTAEEYAIKAAFLYHFAQFVEWPDGTFRNPDSPLIYCTMGEDPFHGALEANLLGKKIHGHQIQVQHAKRIADLQSCHVLFIGEDENKTIAEALASLKGRPVLLVGESERFAQDGGMIGFCVEEKKIRFEINLDSAEKAQLKISAKLLALAKTVIGGSRGD